MELHWVPFYTVTHFHQFPFWNPYKCGGMPMLGNPQSRILTPFFIVQLLFGPLIGTHIEIIAHLAIAFAGAYLLARSLRQSRLAAIACGGVFAGSSWFSLHVAVGHATFMGAAYIPWVLAIFWLGVRRRPLASGAAAGFLVALILLEGGIYPAAYAMLMLAMVAIALSVEHRKAIPLAALVVVVTFAVAFSAPKWQPLRRKML